jgi:hypothetical protein
MDHSPSASVGRPEIVQKVTRRLIPFVGICYLIAYIDRQNVSFAKLQMVGDLGLSEYAYGLGASLFFIGYFLFEVPSNVIMEKVGARRWFARIMISWGLVTIALAYTQNTAMFYILRFLLGACEAGFFPGVLYLLTIWFPFSYRAKMVGSFMLFSAIANAVGAPIGGVLLDLDGLLRGIPALRLRPELLAADDRPGLRRVQHGQRVHQHYSVDRCRACLVVQPALGRQIGPGNTVHCRTCACRCCLSGTKRLHAQQHIAIRVPMCRRSWNLLPATGVVEPAV